MNSLKTYPVVSETTPILDAIRTMDEGRLQIALVERQGRLVGTLTDGDVRRALLSGATLSQPVQAIMNNSPIVANAGITNEAALALMRKHSIHQLPIIDANGMIAEIKLIDDLTRVSHADYWVVLMAGGQGTRLRPLTEDLPKPLIKVGGRPILETILSNFIAAGFAKFFFSVNYKAEMIQEYFGDGSKWGVDISYLEEKAKLGTAGALSLLPSRPVNPIVVMNGDLLTTINFQQLIKYHQEHKAVATACVLEHTTTIPYGVVEISENAVTGIREKPTLKQFINAGVYLLQPEAFNFIEAGKPLDMPSLLNILVGKKKTTVAFPLREYWIDIGRLDDLKRASDEYQHVFGE
ncbi:MAG: nucleotidyltransferase family protein [Xanthobacteraceae bacterium]|nr:nucleotidyltransferase family protein [Xanthobacteraceae bacterium]